MAAAPAIRSVRGGVAAPKGFKAAGIAAGIKKSGAPDLVLLLSDAPCLAAGVFTTSRVKAHPVLDAMSKLRRGGEVRGVLVNSGSANACTGPAGMADLKAILGRLSRERGLPERSLLMSSTGVIGERLPAERILAALPRLRPSARGGAAAARGIMTTDTYPKSCGVAVGTPGGRVTIGGMAKGAGMINPNMATMLAFLTTDARFADPKALKEHLRGAADATFNRLDLDGDTSTNDTLLLLANGRSGVAVGAGRSAEAFRRGLEEVCRRLAMMIAGDTEGATKVVAVRVTGAASAAAARKAARTVAESPLVKTAMHGEDPNWGRVMAALGRSGAAFDPMRVDITVNNLPLVRNGVKNPRVTEGAARRALRPREIDLLIDLKAGKGEYHLWTGDLTADYVRINASYRS